MGKGLHKISEALADLADRRRRADFMCLGLGYIFMSLSSRRLIYLIIWRCASFNLTKSNYSRLMQFGYQHSLPRSLGQKRGPVVSRRCYQAHAAVKW
jgi:hypothetical protein